MNGKNSLFYKCLDGGAALLLVLAMVVPFLPARMDTAAAVSTTVVISQVYGGGGNAGATYRNDFIELYNLGTATVDLSGWSVQYGSATGSTWAATPLSGSIAPGHYYLVKEAAGAGGTVDLPTPDDTAAPAQTGRDWSG